MKRDEIALQIFLKKMPMTSLTENTLKGFQSSVEQAFEIADVFISEANKASLPEFVLINPVPGNAAGGGKPSTETA